MAYPPWSFNGLNRETRNLSPSVKKCLTTDCPVIAIDKLSSSVSKYDATVLFEFEEMSDNTENQDRTEESRTCHATLSEHVLGCS